MSDALLYFHLALAVALFALILTNRVHKLRGVSVALALLLLATGAHNFMTRMAAPPKGWHMFIGIKLLLALHVIAIVFLMARGTASDDKIARWRKGVLVSATLVMLIGLYYSNFAR